MVEPVDFGGQNEVALRQTIDLVGPDRDLHFSPGEKEIWMMPLLFGKLAYAIYERESFAKVRKLESLRDVVFFDDVPAVHLLLQGDEFHALERRHPSTARDACLGR